MKVKITDRYDHSKIIGYAELDDESIKKLATGKYILTPGWVENVKDNRLVCLALIPEETFTPTSISQDTSSASEVEYNES